MKALLTFLNMCMPSHRCTGAALDLDTIPSVLAHARGHWGEHASAHGREPHQDPSHLLGWIPAPLSWLRLCSWTHTCMEWLSVCYRPDNSDDVLPLTYRHSICCGKVVWFIFYYFICWNKSHKHTYALAADQVTLKWRRRLWWACSFDLLRKFEPLFANLSLRQCWLDLNES